MDDATIQATANEYIPDPKTETERVIQGFFQVIGQRLGDPTRAQHLIEVIRTHAAALEAAYQGWVLDEQAHYNLTLGAVVLAAYRALQPTMPWDEALALLRAAFVEPLRDTMRQGTAGWLDHAPDPYAALVGVSKARERHFFGQAFTFERPRDDDRAYFLDVARCLWHSFFVAEGAPELTPIFCAFDANWIDAIDPDRHGVRFSRPTTLGHGGPLCPFHFYRVAPATGAPADATTVMSGVADAASATGGEG